MPKTSNPHDRRLWMVGAAARLGNKTVSQATRAVRDPDARDLIRAGHGAMDDYLLCEALVKSHRLVDRA